MVTEDLWSPADSYNFDTTIHIETSDAMGQPGSQLSTGSPRILKVGAAATESWRPAAGAASGQALTAPARVGMGTRRYPPLFPGTRRVRRTISLWNGRTGVIFKLHLAAPAEVGDGRPQVTQPKPG